MGPRKEAPERRKAILDAAVRCVARSGFRDTSIDDIVRESGASKGTIYWYFKNKKALLIALTEDIIARVMEMTVNDGTGDREQSAGQQLEDILLSIGDLTGGDSAVASIPIIVLAEVIRDEDYISRIREVYGPTVEYFRNIIERGKASGEFRDVDSLETAWSLMGAFDGLLLYRIAGMPGNHTEQNRLLTHIIIDGLRQKQDIPGIPGNPGE